MQIEADEELTADEQIPPPNNEPIVGVIDTQFNEKVYFHKWVDYRNMLDPNIPLKIVISIMVQKLHLLLWMVRMEIRI